MAMERIIERPVKFDFKSFQFKHFILISIPALILVLYNLIYKFVPDFLFYLIFNRYLFISKLSSLLLGYVIIASFEKVETQVRRSQQIMAGIFLITVIIMSKIIQELMEFANYNYQYGEYIVFTHVIMFLFAGVILGIYSFAAEKRLSGSWKVNGIKLMIIGIPSFYFGLYQHFAYLLPFNLPVVNYDIFELLSTLLFGYSVMSSFQKIRSTDNEDD
ncbi:MAG: hypothetical protein H0Z33_11905 [Bacillaceae bacterium]|nr:hypothetical protein [Bacillaceae bacterium]